MADKPSLFDYVNLMASLAVGGLGIYIAMQIAASADRLSRENMLATTATYLLDDSPKRRQAGVNMVTDTFTGHWNEVPAWVKQMLARMASDSGPMSAPDDAPSAASGGRAAPSSPAGGGAAPSPPGGGAPRARLAADKAVQVPQVALASSATAGSAQSSLSASSDTAGPAGSAAETADDTAPPSIENQLFTAVGGGLPRVYIQIADEAQRAPARALRKMLRQEQLNGDPIIAPPVEKPPHAVKDVQLRFLKSTDKDEATALSAQLSALLGTQVRLVDLSSAFSRRMDVKARTYELWFPPNQAINVRGDAR